MFLLEILHKYLSQCLFELMVLCTEQENFYNLFESLFFHFILLFLEPISLRFDFFVTPKNLWQKEPGPHMNQHSEFYFIRKPKKVHKVSNFKRMLIIILKIVSQRLIQTLPFFFFPLPSAGNLNWLQLFHYINCCSTLLPINFLLLSCREK